MKNESWRTALNRSRLSRPMAFLNSRDMLRGRVLDFGSGKGYDGIRLRIYRYDPYFQPHLPEGKFDTITCIYVLNVLPFEYERQNVIKTIRNLLNPKGAAYFAVRNDRANLKGWTKRNTWQGLVELALPVVTTNSNFTIYFMGGF